MNVSLIFWQPLYVVSHMPTVDVSAVNHGIEFLSVSPPSSG